MTDVGQIIRACRNTRKWTKVKLSQVSGVSLDTIINVERKSDCRLSTFEKLIEAMGYEIEILPKEYRRKKGDMNE